MGEHQTVLDRRDFLRLAAAGLGGGAIATAAAGCGGAAATRGRVPIGVQLYSVRQELAEDLPGTFDRLARIGFEGVEYADYFGRSAQELRAVMDANDLRACGTHIHIVDMQGDALTRTIEFNQALGNDLLIVRFIPEEFRVDRNSFLRLADTLNEISLALEPHGMRVGYHAHAYIFDELDGRQMWDLLAEHTRSEFVMQLDAGWAIAAGQDPAEVIRRHPGRLATMHVKAHDDDDPSIILGQDRTDWRAVIEAAEAVGGIEWYILEYEAENPFAALDASLIHFQTLVG